MVQAWYQGGISVFDFTDSRNPLEIAFFDRGPMNATKLLMGGYWSAYWYNGYIYATEIARGLDVLRLLPSEHLSQNEIDAAALIQPGVVNAQHQRQITWPASPVVARAYLDQLIRSQTLGPERVEALTAALDNAEQALDSGTPGEGRPAEQLAGLVAELEGAGEEAGGRDRARLRSLAETLRKVADRLR